MDAVIVGGVVCDVTAEEGADDDEADLDGAEVGPTGTLISTGAATLGDTDGTLVALISTGDSVGGGVGPTGTLKSTGGATAVGVGVAGAGVTPNRCSQL